EQYSDQRVLDPKVIALRNKVTATVDQSLGEDAARVEIAMNDGAVRAVNVEHAIGSRFRPMSDTDLEAKFTRLCAPHLPESRVAEVIAACWSLDAMPDPGALPRLCTP